MCVCCVTCFVEIVFADHQCYLDRSLTTKLLIQLRYRRLVYKSLRVNIASRLVRVAKDSSNLIGFIFIFLSDVTFS